MILLGRRILGLLRGCLFMVMCPVFKGVGVCALMYTYNGLLGIYVFLWFLSFSVAVNC